NAHLCELCAHPQPRIHQITPDCGCNDTGQQIRNEQNRAINHAAPANARQQAGSHQRQDKGDGQEKNHPDDVIAEGTPESLIFKKQLTKIFQPNEIGSTNTRPIGHDIVNTRDGWNRHNKNENKQNGQDKQPGDGNMMEQPVARPACCLFSGRAEGFGLRWDGLLTHHDFLSSRLAMSTGCPVRSSRYNGTYSRSGMGGISPAASSSAKTAFNPSRYSTVVI